MRRWTGRNAGTCPISAPTAPTASLCWNGCCRARAARAGEALRRRGSAISRTAIAWPANVERIEHVAPPSTRLLCREPLHAERHARRHGEVQAGARACGCSRPRPAPRRSSRTAGLDWRRSSRTAAASCWLQPRATLCASSACAHPRRIGAAAHEVIAQGHSAAHRAAELESCIARGFRRHRHPHIRRSNIMSRGKLRVGLVGVGNCASSFVQGIDHYRGASAQRAGAGPDACRTRRLPCGRHRDLLSLRRQCRKGGP
jgi:hypothetical protein